MLESIRKGASSWIVKIIIIVPLILAFAVWGIEDMLRQFGRGDLAVVGERTISTNEFQESYRLELDAMSRRFGRRLNTQQAMLLGIPNNVLMRMVGSAAVDQHAQKLGLTLSQDAVVKDIQKDPAFLDSSGNYDPRRLNTFLERAGLTQANFLIARRRDAIRSIVTTPLLEGVVVPESLLKILHRYNNETRKISYFLVGEKALGEIKDPSDADLKKFYEQRKNDFKTPEMRKITVLSVRAEDLKKTMEIADADLKKRFEQNAAKYEIPEKRTIQQIAFPSKDAAEKARKEIEGGKDFMEVAKAAGAKETDVNLGTLTKSKMIDQKIAEAAFSLAKDKLSQPVEGQFSTVLLRVTKIEAGRKRTFDEVKDELRKEVAATRVGPEIQKIVDKADDLRLSGKTPAEIAKALKLDFKEVTVDKTGRDAGGKAVITGADARNILATAFKGTVGVENETVELRGGGYAWVDNLQVIKAKQKPFDGVKDEAKAAWLKTEKAKRLRELARKLVDKVNKGETLADVAKSLADPKPEVKTSATFKRTGTVKGLPKTAIAQAFSITKGKAATVSATDKTQRIVLLVNEVNAPKPMTEKEKEKLTTTLRNARREDVLRQYLSQLRREIDVRINEPMLRQALGLQQRR